IVRLIPAHRQLAAGVGKQPILLVLEAIIIYGSLGNVPQKYPAAVGILCTAPDIQEYRVRWYFGGRRDMVVGDGQVAAAARVDPVIVVADSKVFDRDAGAPFQPYSGPFMI